jgi:ubiquinone/menaquinone biosynthesis C-methylase UbiE
MVHSGGAAAKRQRAKLFAQWLVDTYGTERLNQGSGVLDVAGGRGALSFELCVKHGVKVTLVEPRPFKLNRLQHKTLKVCVVVSCVAMTRRM